MKTRKTRTDKGKTRKPKIARTKKEVDAIIREVKKAQKNGAFVKAKYEFEKMPPFPADNDLEYIHPDTLVAIEFDGATRRTTAGKIAEAVENKKQLGTRMQESFRNKIKVPIIDPIVGDEFNKEKKVLTNGREPSPEEIVESFLRQLDGKESIYPFVMEAINSRLITQLQRVAEQSSEISAIARKRLDEATTILRQVSPPNKH